jgi:LuxR family maltose regulon positive regulatory protein
LAEGLSYDETARRLQTAVSTVQSHVRNLYRKLGASSKVGAVMRAKALGLFGLAA